MADELAVPWVEGRTIGQVLEATVAAHGACDALVFPQFGLRLSYRQFFERVNEAARGLLALGIRPADHVAIWATNVPQWVVAQFATAQIGAVLVTINPAYRPFELKYVLNQ
ncbi:MAG TPA: AMP-binding protein, partial [Pirellulales bacterium]